MQIGVFSRTYELPDLEETYRRMRSHGLSHTQFNLSNAGLPTLPTHVTDEAIEHIRTLTAAYGITLDALTGTFNMIDPDENAREQGCRQFAEQCRIARELGIPIVSLCTGSKNPESKWKWHDDNLKDASWADLMRSTERVLKCAEDNHIILGVETEASNIINTAQRARKYLDTVGSPSLKIIMDGANLFRPEQVHNMQNVLIEAFALLGKDIVLAHAKDIALDQSIAFTAAGQGCLDYGTYLRLLKQTKYDGPLIMHSLSEQQIPDSKRFLEAMLRDGEILS